MPKITQEDTRIWSRQKHPRSLAVSPAVREKEVLQI